ncbi:MAG: nucleotidyl transferase AbiEii/AbiGii toxin family protein [Nitrospirae bacterium]|nr:nucleotidyl transferase AbiEii/AbiGii toxin family protein [Nitrospirota bacterium]
MFYKAVPQNVASLLSKLNSFSLPKNKYLAGGTAVTLYLGHRISIDIDLFTGEHFLTGPIIDEIKKNYTVHKEDVSDKDSLVAEIEGVRLSLFYYPYTLLEHLYYEQVNKIELASLTDIAAMKTVAIVQRGTAKDFVDLKAIMEKTGMSLEQLISATLKKYKVQENYTYHIKRGLVFFDEAEKGLKDVILLKGSLQYPIDQAEWERVKRFFIKIVL